MALKLGPEQTNDSDSSDGSLTPRFVVTNDRATAIRSDDRNSTPSTLASPDNRDRETLLTRDACKRYERQEHHEAARNSVVSKVDVIDRHNVVTANNSSERTTSDLQEAVLLSYNARD